MSSFAPVILDNGTGYSKIGYAGMFHHFFLTFFFLTKSKIVLIPSDGVTHV
jgi:actin-related protein